jgi:hypothetical protein
MIQSNGNRNLHALRGALPVFAVLFAVLLSALPLGAQASSDTEGDQTWTQGTATVSGSNTYYPQCVTVESTLAIFSTPLNAGVFSRPVGLYPDALTAIYTTCDYNLGSWPVRTPQTVPAGWLAEARFLYYYNGGSQWTVCSQDSNYIYSTSSAPSLIISSPGTSQATFSQAPYTPKTPGGYGPCGAGYYLLYVGGYGWTGTQWLGGWVSSNYLYSQ